MKSKMNAKRGRAHRRATNNEETPEKTEPVEIREPTEPEAPLAKMLKPLKDAGGIYANAALAAEGLFLTSKVLESAGDHLMRLVVSLGKIMYREQRQKRARAQRWKRKV